MEKLQMAGERRLRKLISDFLRVALRVVLISDTEDERGRYAAQAVFETVVDVQCY